MHRMNNNNWLQSHTTGNVILFLLGPLVLLPSAVQAEEKSPSPVVGVVFSPQASCREAVASLQKNLESKGNRCRLVELQAKDSEKESKQAVAEMIEAKPRV